MIGGASFERSQFNRAMQAKRQVGSLFKPFVYTAAIDKGYTAASMLDDVPMSFDAGAGQPPYEPQNYDHEFQGPLTLRRALEQSRNVPAVAMMQALDAGRGHQVSAHARHHDADSRVPVRGDRRGRRHAARNDVGLFRAIPNQGVRMTPALVLEVTDREGNVLEQYRPEPHDALRADTAYIMTELLHGVVEHGTAASARRATSTGRSAARPARPTTTPTRGSSASIRTSRSACGSASIRRRRSATRPPARPSRCRSGSTS